VGGDGVEVVCVGEMEPTPHIVMGAMLVLPALATAVVALVVR
jgi:hypothetical protein